MIKFNEINKNWAFYLSNKDYCSIYWVDGKNFSYYIDSNYYPITFFPEKNKNFLQKGIIVKYNDKIYSPTFFLSDKNSSVFKVKSGFGYVLYKSLNKEFDLNLLIYLDPKKAKEYFKFIIRLNSKNEKKFNIYFLIQPVLGPIINNLMDGNIEKLYNIYEPGRNSFLAWKTQRPSQEMPLFLKIFMENAMPVIINDSKEIKARKKEYFGIDDIIGLKREIEGRGKIEINGFLYCSLKYENAKNEKMGNTKLKDIVEHNKYLLDFFSKYSLEDKIFENFLNIYIPYQFINIFRHRSVSPYSIGAGGLGYRDTCQDLLGIFHQGFHQKHILWKEAEEKLRDILSFQYSNGKAVSGFSPITGSWEKAGKEGVIGKSDVQLWLPLVCWKYISETGDISFLFKKVKTLDKIDLPVFKHCLNALFYSFERRGPNGLPLIGKADWNDALDRVGDEERGESVFNAFLLIYSASKMIEILSLLKNKFTNEIKLLKKIIVELKNNIYKNFWDGKWFIRAINTKGELIGSKKNKEGKIFLNAQSWAVISEIIKGNEAEKLMKIVEEMLGTPYGYRLFYPPYSSYNPNIGRITSFAVGTKENASVFTHANLFKVYADGILEKVDQVYFDLCRLLPSSKYKKIEKYQAEPYVLSEYVISPENPLFAGKGEFTWNTGSCAWFLINASEAMLGVYSDLKGIKLKPRLPKKLKYLNYKRVFRKGLFDFHFYNTKNKETKIYINGKNLKNKTHHIIAKDENLVEVILGDIKYPKEFFLIF